MTIRLVSYTIHACFRSLGVKSHKLIYDYFLYYLSDVGFKFTPIVLFCRLIQQIFVQFRRHCHIFSHLKLLKRIQCCCSICHTGLLVQLHRLLNSSLLIIRAIRVSWHMSCEFQSPTPLSESLSSCHSWCSLCAMMKG